VGGGVTSDRDRRARLADAPEGELGGLGEIALVAGVR
jgi:hypothetical protein